MTHFNWLCQHRFCAHNVGKSQQVTLSAVWTHLTLTKKDARENLFSWLVAKEIYNDWFTTYKHNTLNSIQSSITQLLKFNYQTFIFVLG